MKTKALVKEQRKAFFVIKEHDLHNSQDFSLRKHKGMCFMAEINLTRVEADALLAMPKIKVNDDRLEYPSLGGKLAIPLTSADKRENFFLDLSRGRIDLSKGTYQNRGRHVVVLVRLDFGGPPHRNPDGEEIASPHLHLYREGYGDKWAYPLPIEAFPNISDAWQSLFDFMRYCNITTPPNIQRGLFT